MYIYKQVPEGFLVDCPHPELKGKKYRDLANLASDYESELDKCNVKLDKIEEWNELQKKQMGQGDEE